jgi:hypothetical protein
MPSGTAATAPRRHRRVPSITAVQPVHVAGYIEELTRARSAPTAQQRLSAIRHLIGLSSARSCRSTQRGQLALREASSERRGDRPAGGEAAAALDAGLTIRGALGPPGPKGATGAGLGGGWRGRSRAVTVYRDTHSEGFSQFVTSVAAPVASGWSFCRVGFAPLMLQLGADRAAGECGPASAPLSEL